MRVLAFMFGIMISVPTFAADLEVTIHGLRNNAGLLRLAIFDKAEEFPRGTEVRSKDVSAQAGYMVLVLKDIPPGAYALAIHHDENTNKKMDTNFIGLPEEGYGFSNNARVVFVPPSFESAAFEVGTETAAINLRVVY